VTRAGRIGRRESPHANERAATARPVTPAPPPAQILLGTQHQTPAARLPGWRPNGTRDWLLIYTMAGAGRVTAMGREKRLVSGDVLLIAPNTPQEYGLAEESAEWSNIWAHFRPPIHWLDWLAWPELSRGLMLLSPGPELRETVETELRRAMTFAAMPIRLRTEAALNALERALIALDACNPNFCGGGLDPRIAAAVRAMGENLSGHISIGELSRAAGLSRSRFTVLFTRELRMSPQAYLEAARLGRAAQLLRACSWSITEIAEEVGYSDPFYFSTRFRRAFGASPSRYRAPGLGAEETGRRADPVATSR
jgi:AraC family transcriptional regulator of arabinose operon